MSGEYYVLAIFAALTLFFYVFTYLKGKKRKILESVYNPLLNATYIFQNDFKKDKTNTRQQFKNFDDACLNVTKKYKHLIDQDTNQWVRQLYTAKEILDGTNTKENLESLGGSISALYAHLDIKTKEIKKKPLWFFFRDVN